MNQVETSQAGFYTSLATLVEQALADAGFSADHVESGTPAVVNAIRRELGGTTQYLPLSV